ncbi:MAG: DUF2815 family protein, partial [Ruthenibacterium sp.]
MPDINNVTLPARISYVHVWEPHANQPGQEPKYGVTVLLQKTEAAAKAAIDAAVNAAIARGVSSNWNGVCPPRVDVCIRDGDGVRPSDGNPYNDECKGCWVFTASSKKRPFVVDAAVQEIIDPTAVYSGCYCLVNVDFFPYNNAGKKGIGCSLNGLQKVRDGEPLGISVNARDVFTAMPAQSGGYPQQYGAPAAPAYPAPAAPAYPAPAAPAYPAPAYPAP